MNHSGLSSTDTGIRKNTDVTNGGKPRRTKNRCSDEHTLDRQVAAHQMDVPSCIYRLRLLRFSIYVSRVHVPTCLIHSRHIYMSIDCFFYWFTHAELVRSTCCLTPLLPIDRRADLSKAGLFSQKHKTNTKTRSCRARRAAKNASLNLRRLLQHGERKLFASPVYSECWAIVVHLLGIALTAWHTVHRCKINHSRSKC